MYRNLCRALVILMISFGVQAVQVNDLYQSVVPATSQLPDQRPGAFVQALKHVLLKVSGDAQIFAHPAIASEVNQAEKYVQQFGYVSRDDETYPFELQVTFNEKSIRTLLSDNGLPIWGSNRPSVLFWLAVESGGTRQVVSSSASAGLIEELEIQASYRGIPLYLPVMDLEDENSLEISDLWGLFMEPVMTASERYQPDAVAAMQLYQSALGEWKGRWTLIINGDNYSAPVVESSQSLAATMAIDSIANIVASQYAVIGKETALNDRLELEIADIQSYDEYVDLYKYVASLSPVVSAHVSWIKEDKVRIQLNISGSVEKFQQHVSLDSKLQIELVNLNAPTDSFRLYYRWKG